MKKKYGDRKKHRNSSSSKDEHKLMEAVTEAKTWHRQALTQT